MPNDGYEYSASVEQTKFGKICDLNLGPIRVSFPAELYDLRLPHIGSQYDCRLIGRNTT